MSVDEMEPLEDELEDERLEGAPQVGAMLGMPGSLADRMRAAAEEQAQHRTESFPVPGWAHVFEVELRTIDWAGQRRIADRHFRLGDNATRDLYIAADTIVEATVGFWEVDNTGRRAAANTSWLEIARAAYPGRIPESATPRQAIFALLDPNSRLIVLHRRWDAWNDAERTQIGEELAEDFETTR